MMSLALSTIKEIALRFVIHQGTRWVRFQRRKYRKHARPLNEIEFAELSRFFDAKTLRRVRIEFVPQLENPRIVALLRLCGIKDALNFSRAAGVTYGDLILIASKTDKCSMSLLFHEMVHVAQYETLGVRGFINAYVRGWAENGYEYLAIPLERDAYDLQARYDRNSESIFSVEDELCER